MANVGGDFTEVTFNHPTIGSGTFYPKSGEDGTIDLGGFRSDDEAEGITGSGDAIDVMKNKRWKAEVVCAWSTTQRQDTDVLGQLAADVLPAEWTFAHVSGAIYGGKGKPVGDIVGSGGAGTFPLVVSGGGGMTRIV